MPYISLPPTLINPFDLRYVRDDIHAIAFFNGHPDYEAVEAMVAFRDDGRLAVRAILTQHDQSQIDHINDLQLFNAAASSGRRAIHCPVDVTLELSATLPSIKVRFRSFNDELIDFHLFCASPPDPKRGGISDPGNHALGSSLPIMFRGRSAMASEISRVAISGVEYLIPEKLRVGPYFVMHHGYFTLVHHMAIVRTGTRRLEVLGQPISFNVGQTWRYDTPEGLKTYVIGSRSTNNEILVSCNDGNGETIKAIVQGGRLQLQEVSAGTAYESHEGATIAITPEGAFSIRIDAVDTAVTGQTEQATEAQVTLISLHPSWAKQRPLSICWNELPGEISVRTDIASEH